MMERLAKYGTKEVAGAGSSFRPEAVAQLAGVFAAEPCGRQYGGLFLAASYTARRWLLQLRQRAEEEAAGGGRAAAAAARRRAQERERAGEDEDGGRGGGEEDGEGAAARELRQAATRVAAACEAAGYSVDEVLEPELLQPPSSPSGSSRRRGGNSSVPARGRDGWSDADESSWRPAATGGSSYGRSSSSRAPSAPGRGQRSGGEAGFDGSGGGGGRAAGPPGRRGRVRRFGDDEWSDGEEEEAVGESEGRRMPGARAAVRRGGGRHPREAHWAGEVEPRTGAGAGARRGDAGADRRRRAGGATFDTEEFGSGDGHRERSPRGHRPSAAGSRPRRSVGGEDMEWFGR